MTSQNTRSNRAERIRAVFVVWLRRRAAKREVDQRPTLLFAAVSADLDSELLAGIEAELQAVA